MDAQFWPMFWILTAAGVAASAAALPYSLAINPQAAEAFRGKPGVEGKRLPPMPVMLAASVFQAGLIIALAVFAGLKAALAIGLRLPYITGWLTGQPNPLPQPWAVPASLLVGLTAGLVVIGLERYVFQPRLPEAFHDVKAKQATWKRMLVCFYGGIYEELLLRLFVMGGLMWLIGLVWKAPVAVFWTANLIASLLFGLGHLPATARIAPLTPLIVARALLLNGIAGLFFGLLYATYGLETAILAHFIMDILMHVLLPEAMAGEMKEA